MKNIRYGAATVAMMLAFAASAMAQDAAVAARVEKMEARDARDSAREKIQGLSEGFKKEAEMKSKEFREEAKAVLNEAVELREKAKEAVEAKREEAKERARGMREAAREEIMKAREDARAKVEASRKELKVKLKAIKDERKRGIVETLADKFDKLNAGRVEHFGEVLEKLVAVLGRISDRAAKAKAAGKDIAPVAAAVSAAQNAIDDARAAVKTQAGKVYKVVVTEETRLKDDLGKVRDAYRADVKAVEEKVKSAREAVHAAARTLAGVPGIGELKEAPAPASATAPAPTPVPTPAPQSSTGATNP